MGRSIANKHAVIRGNVVIAVLAGGVIERCSPMITQPMLRFLWNAWLSGMALLCLLLSWMWCQRGGWPAISGSGPRPLSSRRPGVLPTLRLRSELPPCEGALKGKEGLDVALQFLRVDPESKAVHSLGADFGHVRRIVL